MALADSIWVGSKHKEEAWKWVKFLGSEDGQKIIADHGVVFPAIKSDAELAEQVMSKKAWTCQPSLLRQRIRRELFFSR